MQRLAQKSPPPPDASVGVLLLIKEEKVKILNIKHFPSFFKEGCHDLMVVTGW
jgi:hypothetical protein